MGPLVDTQHTNEPLTEQNTTMLTEQTITQNFLWEDTSTWEDQAACRSVIDAADLFFSEDIGEIAAAKRVCAECPVLAPCLEGALDRREPWGVWGGQLFMNGKMLTVKRRRGRPPKVARPEDQMPVIPVPAHLVDQAERLTA